MSVEFYDELYKETGLYKSRLPFDKTITQFEHVFINIASKPLDVHECNYIIGICNDLQKILGIYRDVALFLAGVRKILYHKITTTLAELEREYVESD